MPTADAGQCLQYPSPPAVGYLCGDARVVPVSRRAPPSSPQLALHSLVPMKSVGQSPTDAAWRSFPPACCSSAPCTLAVLVPCSARPPVTTRFSSWSHQRVRRGVGFPTTSRPLHLHCCRLRRIKCVGIVATTATAVARRGAASWARAGGIYTYNSSIDDATRLSYYYTYVYQTTDSLILLYLPAAVFIFASRIHCHCCCCMYIYMYLYVPVSVYIWCN